MYPIPSFLKELSVSKYLKAYFQLIQKQLGSEQVKSWAQGLGITSRISFKHIIRGKKELNHQQIEALQKALDLGHQERLRMKNSSIPAETLVTDKFFVSEEFFATPINTIVLNFCALKVPLKLHEIKAALKGLFSEAEVEKTILNLLDLKLVGANSDGSLSRIFQGKISTIPGVKSNFSREYFKHTNTLVDKAWLSPLHLREVHAFTIPIDSKNIPKLKDLIRKLREDIYQLSATTESDSVYQCSLSSIPIQTPELKNFWESEGQTVRS